MSDTAELRIVPLEPGDVPAALAIQREVYPTFLVEGADAFLGRIALGTSFCLAAKHENTLVGYLLAHGWTRRSPPALSVALDPDTPAEILFLHDLAVSESGRGTCAGRRLVRRAFRMAAQAGLAEAELVAVEGAADYWQRLGFAEGEVSGELAAKIAAYGSRARWMTRQVADAI
ncbi:GNAT family N-acetyltransferase [Qipengyuania sp. JC766]|uniref:GNAT family N-acetyltransferase n=1 Tax=Qipengyuania sp. JC766 TaxID=3232139 RepID=UPI003459600C